MPSRDETLATRLDLVERRTRYLFEEYREQKREIDLRELQELSESPSKFFSKEEIDKRSQVRRELDITIKERVGELSLAITALDKLHPDHTPVP